MPSALTREKIAGLIVTREPAARMLDLHQSQFDRLYAQGRIAAITNENGRAIAFLREDIMALVGGTYRRKPGGKTKAEKAAKAAKAGVA